MTQALIALAADSTPLRLPLGGDSVDAILGHLDAVRDELTRREKVARDTGSTTPEAGCGSADRRAHGGARRRYGDRRVRCPDRPTTPLEAK